MTKKYDAWVEPWIPVEKNDGATELLGIGDALKKAHNLRAVRAAVPTESFGIQRLLITVLTDIFRPERLEHLDDLYNEGSFNPGKIDDYYNTCLKEGATFDLFDAKTPFLQYAFGEEKTPEPKPTATLFDHIPTGNNVPFFIHSEESSHAFTPAQCLSALCMIPHYEYHKRDKKVSKGVNGVPPIYFLYKGETLFETLVLSMPFLERNKDNGFGLPLWRERGKLAAEVVGVPLLHGLMSSPLKIKLAQSEDGLIRKIFFEKGTDYEKAIWKDPHVVYFTLKKKEGLQTLKAKEGREVWRDLPEIASGGALSLLINWEERDIDGKAPELAAYVKYTVLKGVVYMPFSQHSESVTIPRVILEDAIKLQSYKNALDISEQIVRECAYALKRTKTQLMGKGNKDEVNAFSEVIPPMFAKGYLFNVRELFLYSLPKELETADTDSPDWEEPVIALVREALSETVKATLETVLNTISDDAADNLILKVLLKKHALSKLYFIFKRGGYVDNGKQQ